LLPVNYPRLFFRHTTTKLKIKEGSRYFLHLDNEMEIPVGRTKYKEVKEYFDKN
jgi:DNA-binding LytR/AlgR family response regulator